MANTVTILRSNTPGGVPASLAEGQIAINQADGALFYRDDSGAVQKLVSKNDIFASGTKMLFMQASAPTGWTKDTTHNDKAIRIVNGTGGGSGGSVDFSTAFARTATDGHSLSAAENGVHSHTVDPPSTSTSTNGSHAHGSGTGGFVMHNPSSTYYGIPAGSNYAPVVNYYTAAAGDHSHTVDIGAFTSASSGSGTAHSHNIDLRVKYVDAIIAIKD